MRGLYDYIKDGSSFFKGIFWHIWALMTDSEAVAWEIDRDFQLYGKPAMEEIYTFFSSEPKELTILPKWVMFYNTNMFVNPYQDVIVVKQADASLIHAQDFEGSRNADYYLALWKTMYIPELISASSHIDTQNPFEGSRALRVSYDNPYGVGGEALVIPRDNIFSYKKGRPKPWYCFGSL
jgi:hypothetical protein